MNVTVYHLEMASPARLVPPSRAVSGLEVREVPSDPALIRRFYLTVGERFHWVDRRPWTLHDWTEWAEGTALTTLVAWVDRREAGFAVLDRQAGGETDLAYFGLLGEFIGKGYGSAFLHHTVGRAWALGARRVRLHTCTLDHPSALLGYVARGFRVYDVVEEERNEDGTARG